jgi:predicted HicB family RNase H-like nuclease
MTVTLELKPEVEERVIAEAKARGLSVEDYILRILKENAGNLRGMGKSVPRLGQR